MGYLMHQFYLKLFHLSQNVYHATEKTAEMREKEWVAKTDIASDTLWL